MKVQTTDDGLKLNATHQLVVNADVNLMGENVQTIPESTEAG
jgi:hypothetical protein